MKKNILLVIISLLHTIGFSQKIEVTGGLKDVITYNAPSSSNLSAVYILYGLNQAKLTFNSTTSNPLKWFRIKSNAKDTTWLKNTESITSTLDGIENDYGYGIVDGNYKTIVWIIDYKQYEPTSLGISTNNINPCDEVVLSLNAPLYGMGYNDAVFPSTRHAIDLQAPISYKSMEFSDAASGYISNDKTQIFATLKTELTINEPPLQNTIFTLGDDPFSAHWGLNRKLTTTDYQATAVQAKATTKKSDRDNPNELESTGTDLKGSAPIEVLFSAYANKPTAAYFTWDFSTDDQFKTKFASYTDEKVRYIFSNAGKYYIRLSVSNNRNSCVDSSQVFTVEVSESQLKVPPAFSPNGDGKNDEFLVTYKSIVKFKGWIYNRWGNELFTWDDPSKGWDGKVGGKYVTPGAYYYIIEAEGAEGLKYNLKGPINVFSGK